MNKGKVWIFFRRRSIMQVSQTLDVFVSAYHALFAFGALLCLMNPTNFISNQERYMYRSSRKRVILSIMLCRL